MRILEELKILYTMPNEKVQQVFNLPTEVRDRLRKTIKQMKLTHDEMSELIINILYKKGLITKECLPKDKTLSRGVSILEGNTVSYDTIESEIKNLYQTQKVNIELGKEAVEEIGKLIELTLQSIE